MAQEIYELRKEVGARFGFEASKQGVEKSNKLFTHALLADPEIEQNCKVIYVLLYPQLQDELKAKKKTAVPLWNNKLISMKRRAEMAANYEANKAARKKALVDKKQNVKEQVGRHW